MPGKLYLIKCCTEWRPKDEIPELPKGVRGIYVLLKHRPELVKKYDVVYIGMARQGAGGVRSRLLSHKKSTRKGPLWSHFSVYGVWPNIPDEQIVELEGLFRLIYRRDTGANKLARQKSFKLVRDVRVNDPGKWQQSFRQ